MIHRLFMSRILYWTLSMKLLFPSAVLVCTAGAFAQTPATPINLTLQDALERARKYSTQVLAANIAALLAHEDTVQARAAMLPAVNALNQYIYTQPNGGGDPTFVSSDAPRVYTHQGTVHADIYTPAKRADYRKALAAEAVARAKAEVAARGLIATVVQNYYGIVVAERKLSYAQQSLNDAAAFADITQKQEAAGEVSRADVVKAQLQVEQRRIELQNTQIDVEKARITLQVLIFPDYGQTFTVTDDLERAPALPPLAEVQALAARNNPDIRAAQAGIEQQVHERSAARADLYPNLSVDYFFGMNAGQYALHTPEGLRNYGSMVQAQVNIPVWNWGATRSKIKQADLRIQQARNELSFAQRQLLGNLNAFYLEARAAASLAESLRRSLELASESLRLTLLRYQAGEATALEVVDAQSALAQARNALAEGLVRHRVAIANLQTVTGAF